MQDGNALAVSADEKTTASREKGLNRVLEILDFLHTTQRAIGIGDLAKGVNAPRSTTYTLVRSLVDAGLLEMAGDGNRVYFGKKLYLYGMDYVRGNDLLRRGRQEVDNLSRETGETSELCMLQSGRYTIVHSSPGTRPFRISSATGLQIPLPWTASGRLLLARSCFKTWKPLPPRNWISRISTRGCSRRIPSSAAATASALPTTLALGISPTASTSRSMTAGESSTM